MKECIYDLRTLESLQKVYTIVLYVERVSGN